MVWPRRWSNWKQLLWPLSCIPYWIAIMRQVPVFRKPTRPDIDLLTAVKLYQSLITFVEQRRETFYDMENKAKSFVDNPEYEEVGIRLKRRKRFFMKAILLRVCTIILGSLGTNSGSKISTVSLIALILNCASDSKRILNSTQYSVSWQTLHLCLWMSCELVQETWWWHILRTSKNHLWCVY